VQNVGIQKASEIHDRKFPFLQPQFVALRSPAFCFKSIELASSRLLGTLVAYPENAGLRVKHRHRLPVSFSK
jgi:hypothetical protein